MSIASDTADLFEKYKVTCMKTGSYDGGVQFKVTMADGASRLFSVDDDNWDACVAGMFNWVVSRIEGDIS